MKILFLLHGLPPGDVGGTESYALALARTLQGQGAVVVIVHGSSQSAPEPRRHLVERRGLRVHVIERHGLFLDRWDRTDSDTAAAQIREILREERPDVVHVHHWLRLTRGLVALIHEQGIPVVITLHDTWISCPRAFRIREGHFCDRPLSVESCLTCVPRESWQEDDEVTLHLRQFLADNLEDLRLANRVIA
ncbi:MAG TPA: glycosyltransferase, partial [Planctomycetota bacterium]|nr:glycosyltransferase [Planctomycetota bacterium]